MLRKYFAVFVVMIISMSGLAGCCTLQKNSIGQTYPQNASAYIPAHQLVLTHKQQQRFARAYLRHYFSPWNEQQRWLSDREVLQEERAAIACFRQAPGFAENQQPLSKAWINNIAANMELACFPNHKARAITTRATDVRYLPAVAPSFSALQPAWDDYPFDNLQISNLPANTPVLILQTTVDKAWLLILTHNVIGWIPANAVAYVNPTFIKQWQKQKWLAPLQDNIPIITDQQYRFSTRLGVLYPLVAEENNHYKIQIAIADQKQNAVIKYAIIPQRAATIFPLVASTDNFIAIINSQLGHLYGWGELYGYRDCSATLEAIFAPFGIWLPRNSREQVSIGHVIHLKDLTARQKQKILLEKGVPLLTLIGLPGHIMLYIGQQNHRVYVLQNAWGLHTRNWLTGKTSRYLIGKTFIVPIDYDESLFNSESSWKEPLVLLFCPLIIMIKSVSFTQKISPQA